MWHGTTNDWPDAWYGTCISLFDSFVLHVVSCNEDKFKYGTVPLCSQTYGHEDVKVSLRMHTTLIGAQFCTLIVVCYVECLCHSNPCDCVFSGCLHTTWVMGHGCHVVGMGLPMICPCNIWWLLHDNVLFNSHLWEAPPYVRILVWNLKGLWLFVQLWEVFIEIH